MFFHRLTEKHAGTSCLFPNPIEPDAFGDGVPREPVRPPAEDDLLHRGIDGF